MSHQSRDIRPRCDTPELMPPSFAVTPRLILAAAVPLAVMYAAGVTGSWWPTPDSAAYLGLGRSIVEGRGYVFDGATNTQFTPGLPLILAGLRRLFGDGYWAPNAFVALCGVSALFVMYFSMRRLTRDTHLAFAATLCTAFSYSFYLNSHRILTDVPFALAFWLMLYAAIRYLSGASWWLLPACVLAAIGVALRGPGIIVICAASAGIALGHRAPLSRRLVAATALPLAAGLALGTFYVLAKSASTDTLPYVHVVGTALGAAADSFFLRRLLKVAVALPALAAGLFTGQRDWLPAGLIIVPASVVGLIRLWRRGERLPVCAVALFAAAMVVALGSFGMQERYFLPLMPLLAWAYFSGVAWAVDALGARRSGLDSPRLFRWAVAVITVFAIASSAPRIARDAFYYGAMGRAPHYRDTMSTRAADLVSRMCQPSAVVATAPGEASIIHYLSGRLTVAFLDVVRSRETDPQTVLDFVRAHGELDYVLVDSTVGDDALRDRIVAVLDAEPGLKAVHRGEEVLYKRDRGAADEAPLR